MLNCQLFFAPWSIHFIIISIFESSNGFAGSGGMRSPEAFPFNFFTMKLPIPLFGITTGPLLLVPFIKLSYVRTDNLPLFPWQLIQLAFNMGWISSAKLTSSKTTSSLGLVPKSLQPTKKNMRSFKYFCISVRNKKAPIYGAFLSRVWTVISVPLPLEHGRHFHLCL